MDKNSRIYVAGSDTLIGSALIRRLEWEGYDNIICKQDKEPDLANADAVKTLFSTKKPEYVFLAAGKSGGIEANQKYPAELMLDNLLTVCNIIRNAYCYGTKKLLYLASSCSYPKKCPQPMRIESLLTGMLEPTNEAYAVAKIAGIKLCEAYQKQYGANFITGIPTNTFGPGDDFSLAGSHVIAALIRRIYEALVKGFPSVEIWGTGNPRREFIFVDDLADACLMVMQRYDGPNPINLGGGMGMSIKEVAYLIKDIIGYNGVLSFDTRRPDGMSLKFLDSSQLLGLGWKPKVSFRDALITTFKSYLQTQLNSVNR